MLFPSLRSLSALVLRCAACLLLLLAANSAFAQKVPAGFKAELLYKVPEIEHPSVVTCDDEGNLFVGEDPMDMRGPTTKEFDRILLIGWDKNGGEPRKTVFCENLSAVFGMVWHNHKLYVMHAPHYSVFEDTDGDGVADVRKDLADGFGPPAGVYGFNDHIVTGTRLGMDGLIYVSVGDKGVPKATGADGSSISLEGGGVIRMRPDGTQLEVFSSGTRNHLDVAMDSLDNIFTYDNTDDGLGWWTRFTHHIPTGYYGYPYDYRPHPERHLPRISEHGGGSPVGAACYREAAWPEKFRDAAFHCEWGKQKIQVFFPKRNGASFEATMEDFMTVEGSEPFRPLDLSFSPDGKHMYVADWNYNGWVNKAEAGRVYRVTYVGDDVSAEPARSTESDPIEAQIKSLGHPAHSERMRAQWNLAGRGAEVIDDLQNVLAGDSPKYAKIHAIWTENALIDTVEKYDPSGDWISRLQDADADVRAQAARALGYRRVKTAVGVLSNALRDPDASVRMYAAVGLGRIGNADSAPALFAALGDKDVYARFAMMQALRTINAWDVALNYLKSDNADIRAATLVTLTNQYSEAAVDALAAFVDSDADVAERAKAVQALSEVARKADPYEKGWWGTQPARGKPSRPKNRDWAGTSRVATVLRESLRPTAALPVRLAAIEAFRDAADPQSFAVLREIAAGDNDAKLREQAIVTLAAVKDADSIPVLAKLAGDAKAPEALRREAVKGITTIGSPAALSQLKDIVASPESSPELLALAIEALAQLKSRESAPLLEQRLADPRAEVRIRAINAYSIILGKDAAARLIPSLKDADVKVRQATLAALARTGSVDAVPAMIEAAQDAEIRFDAEKALAAIPDRRALNLYLDALGSKNQELRQAAQTALIKIRNEVANDVLQLNERNELPAAARGPLQSVFSAPVPVLKWQVAGPWLMDVPPQFDPAIPPDLSQTYEVEDRKFGWREVTTNDPTGHVKVDSIFRPTSGVWVLAFAVVNSDFDGPTEFVLGSDDQAVLWVNGQKVYEFLGNRGWNADAAKVKVDLKKGENLVYFQCGNTGGGWDYSLQVSQRDPRFTFLFENVPQKLDPSAYVDFGTKNKGNPERGRNLFADTKGIGCIKCHAVGGEGGKIGPDLTGVGAKYPREELMRSVLEPSNRIAMGYEMTTIVTVDGRVINAIVKSETAEEIELADAEGKIFKLKPDDIDERVKSNLSMMPNGLKDGLTLQDFADIIAYLESLKQSAPAVGK